MSIEISSNELARVLGKLRSVVETKTSLPVLSHVLIESVKPDTLRFTATDLDNTLQIEAGHGGLFTGTLGVALDRLLGLAKSLPDEDLSIVAEENGWGTVRTGTGTYKVAGLRADSFPKTPTGEAQGYECAAADILRGIAQVSFHVATEESKPGMRGVQMELNGTMRFVATSGFSLGLCDITPEQPFLTGGVASWLIPVKAAKALGQALDAEGKVLCWATDSHLFFKQGGTLLSSRRPDAAFPGYGIILDHLPTRKVDPDMAALRRALNSISSYAPSEYGHTRYKPTRLSFDGKALTIAAKSHESEEATEEVDCRTEGEPFAASVDVSLLRGAMKLAGESPSIFAEHAKTIALISEEANMKTTQVIVLLRD